METVPCPGCASPLAPDQEVCEGCRRPRDESQIAQGRELLRSRERSRPRKIAGLFLALAAVAGLFQERDMILKWIGAPGADPMPAPVAVPPSAAPPRTSSPPRPNVLASIPVSPPPEDGKLILFGVVYDLSTGAPVPGARVTFFVGDEQQTLGVATADGSGQYVFSAMRSYWASSILAAVKAPGYRGGQIEDPDPSYLDRAPEDRRQALSEVAPGDLEPVPLRYRDADDSVRLSFALVPDSPPSAKAEAAE